MENHFANNSVVDLLKQDYGMIVSNFLMIGDRIIDSAIRRDVNFE